VLDGAARKLLKKTGLSLAGGMGAAGLIELG
jgi:hypothetical protein